MDAGRTTRKFPSYTTAELEAAVAEGITELRTADQVAAITAEIAARKSGASVIRVTPQIKR